MAAPWMFAALLGRIVVLDGPADLVGLRLKVSTYDFSPRQFTVRGEVVFTPNASWNYHAGCPPAYRGDPAELQDKIVIHESPRSAFCSYEQHARGAGAVGAAAWLEWYPNFLWLNPVPGLSEPFYQAGDARHLAHPVAGDVTERAAVPLVEAVIAGASVEVEFSRTDTVWTRYRAAPGWRALQAAWALNALGVLELAACRLYAFWRADGGPRLSVAQVVLSLEILRSAAATLMPFLTYSQPALASWAIGYGFVTFNLVVGVIVCALFIGYLVDLAASAGLHSVTISSRPRCLFLSASSAALMLVESASWLTYIVFVDVDLRALVAFLETTLLQIAVAVGGWVARRRLEGVIRHFPAPLLRKLTRRLSLVVWTSLAVLATGALAFWSQFHPLRLAVVFSAFVVASNARSYAIVGVFVPIGAAVPVGPLRLLRCFLLRAVWQPAARRVLGAWGPASAASAADGQPKLAQVAVLASDQVSGVISPTPRPVAVEERLLLGCSMAFLKAWLAEHDLTGRDVTGYSVGAAARKATADSQGGSVAERVPRRGITATRALPVARATIFVSYAQRGLFGRLVAALEAHLALNGLDPANEYFWIDSFSFRQHDIGHDLHYLGDVQRTIGKTVVVLDSFERPHYLTRACALRAAGGGGGGHEAWNLGAGVASATLPSLDQAHRAVRLPRLAAGCLFEMLTMHMHQDEIQTRLVLPPEETERFVQLLKTNPARVEAVLTDIDTRRAQASVPSDLEMIRGIVTDKLGGPSRDPNIAFTTFNVVVRDAMRCALAVYSWAGRV